MDTNILRFLDKIDFDKEKYHIFEGAKIVNVEVREDEKKWIVSISLNSLLNINDFKDLCEKSKNMKNVDKIYFNFKFKESNTYLKDYFLYYFDILKEKCPMLQSITNQRIEIEGCSINIKVINKIEEKKVFSLKEKMHEFLKHMGFNDFNIETIYDEEEKSNLLSEIKNNELKKEKKKEGPQIIFGSFIKGNISYIKNLIAEDGNIIVEAYVFGIDIKHTAKGYVIFTYKISDKTDSIVAKLFMKETDNSVKILEDSILENNWYRFHGYIKYDTYMNDLVFNIRDIMTMQKEEEKRTDDAPQKRVELHLHTNMSQMDGLIDYKKLIKKVNDFGHRGFAVTDKNAIQIFPKIYKEKGDLKVLFGSEIFAIDDSTSISTNETDEKLNDTFVVFDFETTGLNAFGNDSIIEIGAVKIKNGEIIEKYNELINPGSKLRQEIINITSITDEMLKGKDNEENAFKRFKAWYKKYPMVAHNAKFDVSFIKSAYLKYNLGEFTNTVIDTLELSRAMNPDEKHHNLSTLVKRFNIEFDETAHHRADYDAEGTALLFHKMVTSLGSNYQDVKDLSKLINKENLIKTVRPFHMNIYAINNIGLKNLFKIISYVNTKYFYKTPRIPKSVLNELREGLIFGSGCSSGEVFEAAKTKSKEDLISIINFYDFIEVNPPSILTHLVEKSEFSSEFELKDNIKKIIDASDAVNKLVCATGDVHTLDPEDNIYREILVNQKQPGGGFHPLCRNNIKTIPNAFFRTTQEMLKDFDFLGEEKAYEIVVTNTNKILDLSEEVEVLKPDLYAPKMENSANIITEMVYSNAKRMYGEKLPSLIEERLEKELGGIIKGEYDVIYLIAQKLVQNSNEHGYIVGSRGSVGSSLVATFMNITEVNPLPPHYVCPKCHKCLFQDEEGQEYSLKYGSGFDMPDKLCDCGTKFNKQGQDIPFETFLGFNADKTPDIDLNFSGEYQAKAHDYTKVLFGENYVYRAGTVTTIAEKTAFGFVRGYMEEKGVSLRRVEIERLAKGITGIKRTSGQHPGGIIVIPSYKDVFDFTPYQYPAENINSSWYTTHFEFHDIEPNVLKLDILGHDDPTVLKYLQDYTKLKIEDVPLDNIKVLSLFSSPEALGITEEQIGYKVGTLGIPEFGTNFVMKMLEEILPHSFADLIKISGLSHGTDVWNGNARDLILNKTCEFKQVIGCRDDIMVYLIQSGIEKGQSFKISEFIRKGKTHKEAEKWAEYKDILKEYNVPNWYISSCEKIKYMFPKAHASAYVINGFRVAYYKLYFPLEYYCVYLSIRKSDFDIDSMVNGQNSVKHMLSEIKEKGFNASDKELNIYGTLEIVNEMMCRGYKIENISLEKSDAIMFKINADRTGLIPPFVTLDGMGDIAAKKIVEERNKCAFVSIEDLQNRGKVSETLINKMRDLGVLNDIPESSQLSLF